MWYQIDRALAPVFQMCHSMGREEWIGVMVGIVVLGYFCMRGFGSRSKY